VSRIYWQRIALRLGMFLGFIAITFGAGTALLLWTRSEPPLEITQKLAAARPWLLAWRFLLFGALIGFWPGFSRCVARWRGLTNDQLARLLQARWHVAAWLFALELLLGQNVTGRFILYLQKSLHPCNPGSSCTS